MCGKSAIELACSRSPNASVFRPPTRSTMLPAAIPVEERGDGPDPDRPAGGGQGDPPHVVEVDQGERDHHPGPERVDRAADLHEPDRAREVGIETAEVGASRGHAVRLPAALYDLSMKLASLRIEGYSGIRSASLELEPDITAVVGENDSGKRRLLEALDAVLGGEPDRGPPSFADGSAVRVVLGFEEREPGEWSAAVHAPIHALFPPSGRRPGVSPWRRATGAGRSSAPAARAARTPGS